MKLSLIFLLLSLSSSAHALANAEVAASQCQQKIASIICEVAPPSQEKDRYTDNRKCLPTKTAFYADKITRAFLLYPAFIKQQFCSLKKIYIEQSFFGPAWSAPVDEKNPKEILIGLRKKDLDTNTNLGTHSSWFEQQSFGGNSNFEIKDDLPTVEVTPTKMAKESFLVFTFLHELAHSFDYQHQYSRSNNDPGYSASWTSISWIDIQQIKPEFEFYYRKYICLNGCNGKFLEPKAAHLVYEQMFKAGFVSQLSSLNAMEDFADSFSYLVMSKYMGTTFTVNANGKSFVVDTALASPQFQKKKEFLERTINSLKAKD